MANGRKTGGRKPGSRNKATRDIKAITQKHCAEAVEKLVLLMRGADTHAVRLGAIKELLDRGYGKSPQGVEVGGKDGAPIEYEITLRFS